MRSDEGVCPECLGAGGVERVTGYRVTGWGYGDAEEIETFEKCGRCDGSGEIEDSSNDHE